MSYKMDFDLLSEYGGGIPVSNSKDNSYDFNLQNDSPNRSFNVGNRSKSGNSSFSFSPCVNKKSEKYAERTDRNQVILQYGVAKATKLDRKSSQHKTLVVQNFGDKFQFLEEPYKYMYQLPYDITIALSTWLDEMTQFVNTDKNSTENINWVDVTCRENEEQFHVCGQIFSNDEEKLDVNSVMLQGSRKTSNGKTIRLNVDSLREFSFFPGQFIALRGLNPDGDSFMVDEICTLSLPDQPKINFLPNIDKLSVIIAAGPFTTSDNLDYQPLNDLIDYTIEHQPDVLILIGPFLPSKHDLISKNLVVYPFAKMFDMLMESVISKLEKLHTKVIVMSSSRDVSAHPIYPCPPFELKSVPKSDKIQFVSDPSVLKIGGVVFGMTSVDVLFDLSKAEISNSTSDRMSRLLEHLMLQRNFYPLYPPNERLNVDYTQFFEYATIPIRPHVLITPSFLRHFIKDVAEVVCVNPGTLSKGEGGGTFCRLQIYLQQLASVGCKFSGCVGGEIIKI